MSRKLNVRENGAVSENFRRSKFYEYGIKRPG
jgi:hypothetical protein